MRTIEFKENSYYKISNFGIAEQKIFRDEEDFARFLFLILYLQSPVPMYNSAWYALRFLRKGSYPLIQKTKSILKERGVELSAFAIWDDKFELFVKNVSEGYLSVYMHRVLTAYSKYFNSRHKTRGHVFSGPFKSELVHQSEIQEAIKRIHGSSALQSSEEDYARKNRWGDLLCIKSTSKKPHKS